MKWSLAAALVLCANEPVAAAEEVAPSRTAPTVIVLRAAHADP
jgi:hypothetical protein